MQSHSVAQLASLVSGRVHGDGSRCVLAARTLQEAGPDDISFLEHERQLRLLKETKAGSLVLAPAALAKLRETTPDLPFTVIEVADPLQSFIVLVQHLQGPAPVLPVGIDSAARIHPTAVLGEGCRVMPTACIGEHVVIGARCQIHAGVVIGDHCRIGDDALLYPNVVLYHRTILGHRVIIHANSVLGADGFGYRLQQGRHVKVPQLGYVEVGDDVEIGACTTIDRGTFQATRIGSGSKIDNLVMIAHNCRIGRHNLIVGQVGMAGSCNTGDYVVLAGQVGVADHVTIHDGAAVGARSGLYEDVPAGQRVLGYPAWPEREAKRILLSLSRLPELCRDVRELKRLLNMKEAG